MDGRFPGVPSDSIAFGEYASGPATSSSVLAIRLCHSLLHYFIKQIIIISSLTPLTLPFLLSHPLHLLSAAHSSYFLSFVQRSIHPNPVPVLTKFP